jgi:hypothetical protein
LIMIIFPIFPLVLNQKKLYFKIDEDYEKYHSKKNL